MTRPIVKGAGASEEKARVAAKAMADYDSRFKQIDQDLSLLKTELPVLRWILGFLLADMVSSLFKAFSA